jgi:hypothetical protein
MGQGKDVTSPDGDRWRVRRRWMDRAMPNVRKRFRRNRKESEDGPLLDSFFVPDALDGLGGIAIAIGLAVFAVIVIIVLLPLIGLLLELLLVVLLLCSGIVGRVLLGRPWTVEAIDLDEGERSVAYAVKGFRNAGHAVDELSRTLAASGPPDRLSEGERTTLPRPTF